METKVKLRGKPLSSAWHEIVAQTGISADPALSVGMHGMFMSGAAVALRLMMDAADEDATGVVQQMVDELNEWQSKVVALMAVNNGRLN